MKYPIIQIGKYFQAHGTKFKTKAQAEQYSQELRERRSQIAGREITDDEHVRGYIEPATDSRSTQQLMADANWKPTKEDTRTKKQRALDNARAELVKKEEAKKMAQMSAEEFAVFNLEKLNAEESAEAAKEKRRRDHANNVAQMVEKLDAAIDAENWNPESDAAFREQLKQAKALLLFPEHDSKEVEQRLQSIDTVLAARQANRESELLQRQQELAAEMARVNQSLRLIEPEKPEPAPMADSEPERQAPSVVSVNKVRIDQTQSLQMQLIDVQTAMYGSGFPLSDWDKVQAAYDSLKQGDEEPARAVLSEFVE